MNSYGEVQYTAILRQVGEDLHTSGLIYALVHHRLKTSK